VTVLKKDEFCKQFIAAFCGAWCAKNYEDFCMRGIQERLEKPPIEDAVYLADTAWIRYEDTVLKYGN
jgi:hypothetical protein